MGTFSLRQQLTYAFLLFVLMLLLVPRAGYDSDMYYWVEWSSYIFEHGLGNVYQLESNNYNPLYHYILWLYNQMMGSLEKVHYYIHFLKGYTLFFDFAGAFWAAFLVRERERRFGLALLLLFNIAYLYNTLLWIQVDSIYTFFAFGAAVLAAQRRLAASVVFFVLALAAKTQAIIFLPPLVLLWVPQWWHRPWGMVQAVLAGVGAAVLVLAPFVWGAWENYLPRIIEINLNAASMYPKVSMNAYNFWYLFMPEAAPTSTLDTLPFMGLTYHLWGLMLFFVFSVLALWPLFMAAVRGVRTPRTMHRPVAPAMPLVMLSLGIIPLLFAFFNTQMHERYWHAAVLFLAAYGFLRRDYLPYVVVSVAYFLNLESVFRYLQLLKYGILVFQQWFIASLFAIAIVLVLIKIYQLAPWRTERLATAPLAPQPVSTTLASAA
jgi:Gpi18-like mannosyltransferase